MAAAIANDMHELDLVVDPGARPAMEVDGEQELPAHAFQLIEGLLARVTLLEDAIVHGEMREIELRDRLKSSDFLLNQYRDLFFLVDRALKNLRQDQEEQRMRCECQKCRLPQLHVVE